MGHWFLSIIPRKSLLVYVVIALIVLVLRGVDDYGFLVFILVGGAFFTLYILINFIRLHNHFEVIVGIIIIKEFIDKRPFREFNPIKKEVILQEILTNVNNSVNFRLKTNYSFTNTIDLVLKYKKCMKKSANEFNKYYTRLPDEELKGWPKITLIAHNIAIEDYEYAINNAYPHDLIQKYAKRKNAPKSIINECIINESTDNLSKNPLDPNKTSSKNAKGLSV